MDVFLTSAFGPAVAVAHAREAERAGMGGVWLAEHHFVAYGQCPSATVLAGHILAGTRRITVGTAAAVLGSRHPVALGEEAALLHALAGDRFQLGVARGGPWQEIEVLGRGLDHYRRGFAESLRVLLRWLSGVAEVGADGEFHRFGPLAVVPRPATPLRVRVAVTSGDTAELAGRLGLPLLLGVHTDDTEAAALVDRWAQAASAHGHDPAAADHARVRLAYPCASRADGERELRANLPRWLAGIRAAVPAGGAPPGRDLAAHVEHLLRIQPVGPPGEVAAALAHSADTTGVRRQLCMVEAAGSPEATSDLIATLAALPTAWLRDHAPQPRVPDLEFADRG
ncbi:alkanal monooxygenase [Catellatospora methionotrophica]|uniref:Alkanal monooxygenase n=1 Tax=Catellatospora methionotrophica TaxID=121620 RepID=A0A8J3L1Y9_9ACTN|nr:LLM class flavin-dependent oxidoreductase [Catellatospora methionotrophica]GIG13092.1 alkanal monooxygenase [Catellatospora methionotrophica]